MNKKLTSLIGITVVFLLAGCGAMQPGHSAENERARELQARKSLNLLYKQVPGARALGSSAEAVLIFPEITKAGLLIGGQYGTGVLFKDNEVAGYYRSTAASYGLQAGVQTFGYALFFMGEEDLEYLKKSDGWEIGVGPTVTVVDHGFANSFTTTTTRKGVYVFFFEQKGLMAGLGIQGTKITETDSIEDPHR